MYGSPDAATPSTIALSSTMQDYWISFAVTLDPNDGKGNKSKYLLRYLFNLLTIIFFAILTGPQWLKYKTPEQVRGIILKMSIDSAYRFDGSYQNILKLDGRGIETIRDDYRAEQMAFIANNAEVFHL